MAFTESEGDAAGITLDPAMNEGTFIFNLAIFFTDFVLNHSRGLWSVGATNSEVSSVSFAGVNYGGCLWWDWLRINYDPYHQVMRRIFDILQTTVAPKINTFLGLNVAAGDGTIADSHGSSNRLAMKQALSELHGVDLSLAYKDFAISLSLLRNNTSIPSQYRSKYPYWISQSDYVSVDNICLLPSLNAWWEDLDTNANPSTAAGTFGSTTDSW